MIRFLAAAAIALCALATPAMAQQRAPLDWFVGYDQFRSPDISPEGRYIALIRREAVGDVLVVYDRQTRQLRPIQVARADQQMEMDFVEFKSETRLVFGFSQKIRVVPGSGSINRTRQVDDGFQFSSRVYAINVDGSNPVSLYDPQGQGFDAYLSAGIVSLLPNDDEHVMLIAPAVGGAQLRRVNINTGTHTVADRGGLYTFGWVVDVNGTPVLRQDAIGGGRGRTWSRRGPNERNWTEIARFRGAEGANSGPTFEGVGPAVEPGQVFVLARRDGEDTSGLYTYDTSTGRYVAVVHTNPDFDVSNAIRDLDNNTILAACWWGHRWTCAPKEENFARYWTGLTRALGDNVNVRFVGRAGENGNLWLLNTNGPQDLGTFYLYDTSTRALTPILTARSNINAALLPQQRVVEYTASDGMRLWGYLWIPPGVTNATNLPLIVVPHGGPEGRDVWGFDPFAMTFASQGYAVFQPNFRGGGGSGRRFVEAGHGQWGQRMQEDVADGTRHLIQQGIADPNRICITGWSYGGYVAMTATFVNADLYKCSVAGAGVSDLLSMMRWVRSGSRDADVIEGGGQGAQSISYQYWSQAIGNPSDERLRMFSAALNAERATVPLLLIHGDEDQTVPIEQSEIMERAMRRVGRPARLVRLVDTDHYFRADQEDAWRTTFTEALAFYNQHIGPGVAPGSQ